MARLHFQPRDKKAIPLRELIVAHEQFRPSSALLDNLGDGFLYATNPIFRNIRKEYLRMGFTFTQADFCDYFAYPLMSLDEVIAAKKIPYRNNFIWLKKLPKSFTLTDLKRGDLEYNYLFHESAHFIAHKSFFGARPLTRVPKTADSLIKILAGEAFANTVEVLSFVFVEGEIGIFFLDANCHFRADVKTVRVLMRAKQRIGFTKLARVLLAAFLYSNYMYQTLNKKQLAQIRAFAELPKSENILPLVRIGLSLCEEFRSTTTQLHLMKLGFPAELEKLMKRDPLVYFESHKTTKAQFLGFADCISKGL